jgi:hypothetical protein
LEYKFIKINDITTSDVTEGIKIEVLKKFLNFINFEFNKLAKKIASEVVIGTVPNVKINVFFRAFQNNLSFAICL